MKVAGQSEERPFEGPREAREARETQESGGVTVDDVLALKSVGGVALSPDGYWVAYIVTERDAEENQRDSNVFLVSTEGGEAFQLTYQGGSDTEARWAPDGSWLAFLSDRDEGTTQVYGIRPKGGEAWQVTESPTSVVSYRFSGDGSRIAFTAAVEKSDEDIEMEEWRGRPLVRDSAYSDDWARLWIAPMAEGRAGERELASPDSLHVTSFAWAPDSETLAFAARPSPDLRYSHKGAVFVRWPGDSGLERAADLPGREWVAGWTESLGLLIGGSGHERGTYNDDLWRVPAGFGEPVSLTEKLDENAELVYAGEDMILVGASVLTGRGLFEIELEDGGPSSFPVRVTDDDLFMSGFSASWNGSRIAFVGQSPTSPPNVYVASSESAHPRRLTDVNPRAAGFELGHSKVVRWKSRADGEQIEGVLTLPVGYREGRPVPLLLRIHGGPAGVSTMSYNAAQGVYPTQVFAAAGYAVLQPNYRGSTGYGERFRGLNRGDISGKDWIDIDSGVDALIEAGVADADRLGIMGWSFGGHHTYWGITQTQRFKAASAGAGANELISMYHQTDAPGFYRTYLGPAPWEDFDLYEERSAYRNVERVTTPLLIQVGELDERVPKEQSRMFYEAVRAIGKAEVKMVVYPDQPHGVRAPRLERDVMTRNVEWFMHFIPVDEPGGF